MLFYVKTSIQEMRWLSDINCDRNKDTNFYSYCHIFLKFLI